MNIFQKIKAALKVKKEIDKLRRLTMSASVKSTEFWLNLVGIIGTIYAAVQGFIPADTALKIAAGLVVVYTVARQLVKAAAAVAALTSTTKDDKVVEAVNAVLEKLKEVFKIPGEKAPNA